jgi:phage terminase large subunit-like protein
MWERNVYTARFQFTSSTDKATRAQSIRNRIQQVTVGFPHNAPYTPVLVSELMTFPAGTNDDQVDTLSLIGRVLPGGVDRPSEIPDTSGNSAECCLFAR